MLLLRDPGALLHAEFWAEDGWIRFPDAYAAGWHSLLWPRAGYLQTASRLAALVVQPLPLAWAPTLFAAVALAVQALPPAFLLSRRMDRAWPSVPGRMLFALLYVALPNSFEVSANLTNAQWQLAVLGFLVLVSARAEAWSRRVFDALVLGLSGLSGPICLFLLPVAAWRWREDRDRQTAWRAAIVGACVVAQGGCLLATMHADRSAAPLGAAPATLARIVALQIFLGALLGTRLCRDLAGSPVWTLDAVPILLALAGGLISAMALRHGSPLLRKAACVAGALFAAALWHPQVSLAEPQWLTMTRPGAGQRYYFIPMLVWLGVLLTLAASEARARRWPALALLLLLPFGIAADWLPPRMAPTGFAAAARAFALAPPGTRAEFPVHPPGARPMVLVKRQ